MCEHVDHKFSLRQNISDFSEKICEGQFLSLVATANVTVLFMDLGHNRVKEGKSRKFHFI